MAQIINILLMIASVAVILLSLLQSGKAQGFTGAFTGSSGLDLFSKTKERGAEKVISRLTMVAGISFFVLVILAVKFQI